MIQQAYAHPGRQRGYYQPSSRSGVHWWVLIAFGLYLAYDWFAHQEVVPITGRKQLVDISREQEAELGLQSYQEVLHTSRVLHDGREVDAVRTIGARLARATKPEDPGFQWEFNVIQSDEINAFCLPGGKVAVYTGILPVLKNADGLAIVMGHEIGHAIARHGAERIAHQKLVQLGAMAAGAAMSNMDPQKRQLTMAALGAGAQFGVVLPFSRAQESEADHLGLLFAARACFDPREAPKLWERMSQSHQGGRPPEFASTHPSDARRITQLEGWMPEALKVREQSGCPALPAM